MNARAILAALFVELLAAIVAECDRRFEANGRTRMTTVLLSSSGRRVELLRSFLRAFDEVGEGTLVLTDADPLVPTFRACRDVDRSHVVPRVSAGEYVDAMLEICREDRVDVIFPLIDPDIAALVPYAGQFNAVGTCLAIPAEDGVMTARDKWLTARHFAELGLRTPDTWLGAPPTDVPYPLFIKPRFGSASQSAFPVRSKTELDFFLNYVPDPLVQQLIRGREVTTDVFSDLQGRVIGAVCRERLQTRAGEVSRAVTIHNEQIASACVRVATKIRAIGAINIQCILADDGPVFTEINARFGGGAPLAFAAGVRYPELLLRSMHGEAVQVVGWNEYQAGLVMSRYDDSFFFRPVA